MSLNNLREVTTRQDPWPGPYCWSAWYEGEEEGRMGQGATEQAAIDDLRGQDDE